MSQRPTFGFDDQTTLEKTVERVNQLVLRVRSLELSITNLQTRVTKMEEDCTFNQQCSFAMFFFLGLLYLVPIALENK